MANIIWVTGFERCIMMVHDKVFSLYTYSEYNAMCDELQATYLLKDPLPGLFMDEVCIADFVESIKEEIGATCPIKWWTAVDVRNDPLFRKEDVANRLTLIEAAFNMGWLRVDPEIEVESEG